MAVSFNDVTLHSVLDGGKLELKVSKPLVVQLLDEQENLLIRFRENESSPPIDSLSLELFKDSETARFGDKSYVIREESNNCNNSNSNQNKNCNNSSIKNGLPLVTCNSKTTLLTFNHESDVIKLADLVRKFKQGNKESVFAMRTDESSAAQYFQFYGYLSQQQNMMQDFIRTSTYQKAILSNTIDFQDKVVLDVGAGSGILSFFAVQAGARKVYAVEASSMAKHAEQLVFSNKLSAKICVIPGKIEEITIPENVDMIISEPMGYMLFNERMLETYLHAKKWLKSGGKMFPTIGDLHIAPFQDAALYMEQLNKANFWYQEHFHGVDLSSLRNPAVNEYFRQPIVDTFDIRICNAKSFKFSVDFQQINESDLHQIEIPFSFTMMTSGEVHGLAFWFDVAFLGSQATIWLSTSPTQPLTHWYQVRCLIDTPIFVHRGNQLTGKVNLISNKRQSYDVEMELLCPASGQRVTNTLDLKNPYFRYTGQAPQPPPGTLDTSPSEQYWQTIDSAQILNPANGSTALNGATNQNTSNLIDVSQLTNAHHVQQQQQQQMMHQVSMLPSAMAAVNNVISGNSNCRTSPPGGNSTSSSSSSSSSRGLASVPVQVPCSQPGGGITPSMFQQQPSVALFNSNNFPVNNSLMIGDYAVAAASGGHQNILIQSNVQQQQMPIQQQQQHHQQQQHPSSHMRHQ